MKNQVCCCTGHRPQKFPFDYDGDNERYNAYIKELKSKIEYAITERNITHFISGMALGVDLDFAELVLYFKDTKYKTVTLECAIPCPNQTIKWTEKDKLRYNDILKRADTVTLLSDRYDRDCMLKRNRFMVDKSQMLIAVFNGIEQGGTWYTIKYAKSKNKLIEMIDLCKLK